MYTTSNIKAVSKYRKKAENKQKVQYWNRKSTAKNFILKNATKADLQLMQKCINQRNEMLKQITDSNH